MSNEERDAIEAAGQAAAGLTTGLAVMRADQLRTVLALARRIEVLERLVTPAWELRNALDRHPCEVCGRVAETEHAHGAVCWRFEQALRATDALFRLDSLDDTTQRRGEHGE